MHDALFTSWSHLLQTDDCKWHQTNDSLSGLWVFLIYCVLWSASCHHCSYAGALTCCCLSYCLCDQLWVILLTKLQLIISSFYNNTSIFKLTPHHFCAQKDMDLVVWLALVSSWFMFLPNMRNAWIISASMYVRLAHKCKSKLQTNLTKVTNKENKQEVRNFFSHIASLNYRHALFLSLDI